MAARDPVKPRVAVCGTGQPGSRDEAGPGGTGDGPGLAFVPRKVTGVFGVMRLNEGDRDPAMQPCAGDPRPHRGCCGYEDRAPEKMCSHSGWTTK